MDDHSDHTDTECIICYNIMADNTRKLDCGHEFHNSCLNTWIDRRRSSNNDITCPTCRSIIEQSSSTNLESHYDTEQFFERVFGSIGMYSMFPNTSYRQFISSDYDNMTPSLVYDETENNNEVDDQDNYIQFTQEEQYYNFSMWSTTQAPEVHDFGVRSSNIIDDDTLDDYINALISQSSFRNLPQPQPNNNNSNW
jgi:hypothetical protein